jgi:Flp pilus assembly protein TadD
MAGTFTKEETERHNALITKGWSLVKDHLILHGRDPAESLSSDTHQQLHVAIHCFEQALTIYPEGWSSMWALGKIYQRLGDQQLAFKWFARAYALKPEQPDVVREAGIAALDIGRIAEGVALCRAAAERRPDDPGIICNLALAYCMAGEDINAEKCAADALARNPTDEIVQNVVRFVQDVKLGKRDRPTQLDNTFPYE